MISVTMEGTQNVLALRDQLGRYARRMKTKYTSEQAKEIAFAFKRAAYAEINNKPGNKLVFTGHLRNTMTPNYPLVKLKNGWGVPLPSYVVPLETGRQRYVAARNSKGMVVNKKFDRWLKRKYAPKNKGVVPKGLVVNKPKHMRDHLFTDLALLRVMSGLDSIIKNGKPLRALRQIVQRRI